MDWTIVATVIASLGGREFFAWLANRKTYARKETANARAAEFAVYEAQLARYEKRLEARDAKVDAIYAELREEQQKNLRITEENAQLKLTVKVMTLQKCERRGCSERQPPGAY